MAVRKRSPLLALGALVAIVVALFLLRSGRKASPAAPASGSTSSEAPAAPGGGAGTGTRSASGAPASGTQAPAPGSAPKKEVLAELHWGSGPSELGRHRPQEANPEAPMSMAVDILGNMVVLDQTNGRLLRLDPEGKPVGSLPLTQQTPQDVAMAKDGSLLVLDRLRDKTVAILNPDTGALRGELPVEGKGIPEGGLVTGTFVDGDSVYVEREHGALVRIGDTSGTADPERPEIPGRPTRDGRSYVLASITDRKSGRVLVNAVDRSTGQHRYTREYRLEFPVMSITLLDSDLSGTLYLGVAGELTARSASATAQLGVRVFCIDSLEGKVLGQTDLPLNTLPEETFRDFAVLDEGGVLYRHITESGVTLMRARCR
ncbi:PQQ-binding-like beta-propeller repeat protein [Hyalangium versicolor]|uniref:PQQ-binding-like beta-propeller repeat protein n=1 Tax=Hyalangium versicolor TaxID=2861190 RepID=UPI001CC93F32|nr:PQQ-binding-like beta-propeller repeat protein [Hyalangium versicolor]